jgi:cytochrome P450
MQPSLGTVYRQLVVDEVLPLSTPLKLKNGREISELPVPSGTKMLVSIEAYNRHPDIWGPDAGEFNPRRWLDANGKLGMKGYSDTFVLLSSSGRCIELISPFYPPTA